MNSYCDSIGLRFYVGAYRFLLNILQIFSINGVKVIHINYLFCCYIVREKVFIISMIIPEKQTR